MAVGKTLTRSLAIVGIASVAALAHSWAVQAGERPISSTSALGETTTTTLDPSVLPTNGAGDLQGGLPGAAAAPAQAATLGFEITTEQAFALHAEQLATFIDTRLHEEFEAGHIAEAFWLPANLFDGGMIPEVTGFLDPAMPIVLYCGGGECDASKNTALLLRQMGFEALHVYTDGYPAWVDAGHPTDTGPDPFTGGTP